MIAHRVGVIGALIAVIVLSCELGGALAWKHRAVAPHTDPQWETLRGTELTFQAVQRFQSSQALDSTLEEVTIARESLELK